MGSRRKMMMMRKANSSATLLLDDSSLMSADSSCSDLDDSNVTLKMSNRRRPFQRSPSDEDVLSCSRARVNRAGRMKMASRWESFPDLRRRGPLSAPPKRGISPSPSSSSSSVSSAEETDVGSRKNHRLGAPRVPQRTPSDADHKPDSPRSATGKKIKNKRKQVSFSPSCAAPPETSSNTDPLQMAKMSYRSRSNNANAHHALKLPTRQPSFQT